MTAIHNLFKDLNGSTVYRFPINYANYPDLLLENASFLINIKRNDSNGWRLVLRIEKDGKSLTKASGDNDMFMSSMPYGANPPYRSDRIQLFYKMFDADGKLITYVDAYQGRGTGLPLSGPYDIIND